MKRIFLVLCIAFTFSLCYSQNEKETFNNAMNYALKGDVEAQYTVGCCYLEGIGTEVNEYKAFEWCKKAALQGDADSQSYIGWCYFAGIGTEKNENKGFEWSLKAARQGDAQAQYDVGASYKFGIGTEKNEYKAFEWYMKAALQGNADAQCYVGLSYMDGIGVEKYENEGFKWLSKSAAQGYANGFNNLAYCYMQGKGVAIDKDKAWECLNKALELEPQEPMFLDSKGEFYSMENNREKALEVYEEIKKIAPNYYDNDNNVSPFFSYIKGLNENNVDTNIPSAASKSASTFAVVFSNETYARESAVPYVKNDGEVFAKYCEQTLGIPNKNIKLVNNATLNDMKYNINWLKNVLKAYNGEAKVIFYYAGHGIPDEKEKTAYLLPVDGYGSDVRRATRLMSFTPRLASCRQSQLRCF